MLQLIKLEIRKYKLKKYIKGVIIAIICIMAFLAMSFYDTLSHLEQKMDTYKSVIWMINVLSTDVFLIFSASILAKIIIGEYKSKTILVMFSYPVNRKKLILAKLIIVIVFAMSCILISDVFCTLYVAVLDSIIDVVSGSFTLNYIYDSIFIYLGFTVMSGVLSLMPFAVGMKKKSVPGVIVTAVVIVGLMQPVIGRDPQLKDTLIKLVIATLITLAFAGYTIIKKINDIDTKDVV